VPAGGRGPGAGEHNLQRRVAEVRGAERDCATSGALCNGLLPPASLMRVEGGEPRRQAPPMEQWQHRHHEELLAADLLPYSRARRNR
jgi:hypothetical protein